VHDGFPAGEGKLFEFRSGLGEFVRERDFAALDQRVIVKVEAAGTRPVAGARKFEVFESPAKRETERVVEFGTLAGGERELREAAEEPGEWILATSGGVEPACPGNVGFDIGIFFEERNESRPGRAASALGVSP